jgi:hypothetical protein
VRPRHHENEHGGACLTNHGTADHQNDGATADRLPHGARATDLGVAVLEYVLLVLGLGRGQRQPADHRAAPVELHVALVLPRAVRALPLKLR